MPDDENNTRYGRLRAFLGAGFSDRDERETVRRKFVGIAAGETILFEGQADRPIFMVMSGWACSVRHLLNGSDHVLDVRLPGDFIGGWDLMLQTTTHATEAITATELYPFTYDDILTWDSRSKGVVERFAFALQCEKALMIEHMIDIARRKPQVRTAHFLLELSERVSRAGLGSPNLFTCPLSQYLLADTLGLTAVHLNRTLRSLREMGLVSFRHSVVTIHNRPEMIRFAGFDPAYLYQMPANLPARRWAGRISDDHDRRGVSPAPRQH